MIHGLSFIIYVFFVGASINTVDLLPKGKSWTESLEAVEGHETAYKFDGKTAVKVSLFIRLAVRRWNVVFMLLAGLCMASLLLH